MNAATPPAHGEYEARSRLTQKTVLDSAVAVLVEAGYSGASTLKIQQCAGVSRGRLLHQFPNRDELLVAAVQHLAEARVDLVNVETSGADSARDRVAAVVQAMWSAYQQDYFIASTELWVAARHNPRLAAALSPREQELGARIRKQLDALFGRPSTDHPNYPSLREVLNTSMRGVALAYCFEPGDPQSDPHLSIWTDLAIRELDL